MTTADLTQYERPDVPEADIREQHHDGTWYARWIGVTPPDHDDIDKARMLRDWYAVYLADEVAADADAGVIAYRVELYLKYRAEVARLETAYKQMWASGRFAGSIVDRGSLTPDLS